MASALAAFSAAAASAAAADAAWRSASRALASALASTGGPVVALGTDVAAGAGASDAAGASGSGAGAGAARLGVGYALGAGASSGMPAFFFDLFHRGGFLGGDGIAARGGRALGSLALELRGDLRDLLIDRGEGELGDGRRGDLRGGHGGDGVRRRSGIKIEIVIHWNIHQQPSFDAGTKACGAVRRERGGGIGGRTAGRRDGGGRERRDDRALHVGDASVAVAAGSGHDARTRDTAGSLLRRASGNEPRGLLRREGGRVRGVNDGGHLWCAWTREEVGGCVCRRWVTRANTGEQTLSARSQQAVANQLSETTIRVRKQLFGSSQIEESQP